jgi:hypothetical protein
MWLLLILLLLLGPALLGIFVFKQTPIQLRHKESGLPKVGRHGWSWTYLYFGWLVPMFRGEIGMGLLHFLFSVLTLGIFQVIWSFLYNKQHLTRLMTSGWQLDLSDPNFNRNRELLQITI